MKPYVKYDEGFIDEGDVNLFAVMKELLDVKYTREIYPEHPRALDYDREHGPIQGYPGGGGYAGDVYDMSIAFSVPLVCFSGIAIYGYAWPALSRAGQTAGSLAPSVPVVRRVS